MNRFYLILLLLLSGAICAAPANARKVKTVLKITKTLPEDRRNEETKQEMTLLPDDSIMLSGDGSVTLRADLIKFAGYDKQVSSKKETFLIVNQSEATIRKVIIKITYKDLSGRMLHSRETEVSADIPPHETRQTDINSWDKQNSYYYYLSNPPRRVATPYKVDIELVSATIDAE